MVTRIDHGNRGHSIYQSFLRDDADQAEEDWKAAATGTAAVNNDAPIVEQVEWS